MAYNFYVDNVLFTVQTVSVNFKSFVCYIYLVTLLLSVVS